MREFLAGNPPEYNISQSPWCHLAHFRRNCNSSNRTAATRIFFPLSAIDSQRIGRSYSAFGVRHRRPVGLQQPSNCNVALSRRLSRFAASHQLREGCTLREATRREHPPVVAIYERYSTTQSHCRRYTSIEFATPQQLQNKS